MKSEKPPSKRKRPGRELEPLFRAFPTEPNQEARMVEAVVSRRGFLGHLGGAYAAVGIVGGAGVATGIIADPLLTMVRSYKRCLNDCELETTDQFAQQYLWPIQKVLFNDPPPTTTMKGATEALRLVIDQEGCERCDEVVLKRVLEFLDSQAA